MFQPRVRYRVSGKLSHNMVSSIQQGQNANLFDFLFFVFLHDANHVMCNPGNVCVMNDDSHNLLKLATQRTYIHNATQ
jgi:hypothetical protein